MLARGLITKQTDCGRREYYLTVFKGGNKWINRVDEDVVAKIHGNLGEVVTENNVRKRHIA